MSHKDAGNYKAKRTETGPENPEATELVRELSNDGEITCADAHEISRKLGISPAEVGGTIDRLEIKIVQCQLGLFGHEGGKRNIVTPAEVVSPKMKDRIMKDVVGNEISCHALWNIAEEVETTRLAMTAACEALNLKIRECQLGAF